MTATGNEAVSLEQLKDYADNQSAGGGGSGYTYEYLALTSTALTYGNWKLERVSSSRYADPRLSICYNDNELTIEGVTVLNEGYKWGVTVSSNSGNVHFLGASNSAQETYPMYAAAPCTSDANTAASSVMLLEITKNGNVLTVDSPMTFGYAVSAYPRLKFYITED